MHTRRVPRVVLSGAAAVLAVAGLAACRTSPNVAAYVGDDRITVGELQAAVDSRLEEEGVAAFAEADEDAFTRQVLGLLVGEQVYAAAAENWDVTVTDGQVRERIDALLADNDPDQVYEQLAAQGIGREDVFENVRQQLVRQGIARAEGLDDAVSEATLRQRYEQDIEQYQQYVLGYITVPDQPTADAVLAQLTADPASYAALAATFPGDATLAQPEARAADELPQALAAQVPGTAPGSGFTLPVEGLGVVVAFVADVTARPFEEVRADLEDAASAQIDDEVQQLVQDFRGDLDVTVNPRYGVLRDNAVVRSDEGVVDILDGEDAPAGTTGG
ncbi:peptidylprolyl isomerase [Geodermatophilus sp. SYSU D00815]